MIDSNKTIESNGCCLSQIEINTIASSFGSATTKLFELHRYMLKNTNNDEFIKKVRPNYFYKNTTIRVYKARIEWYKNYQSLNLFSRFDDSK